MPRDASRRLDFDTRVLRQLQAAGKLGSAGKSSLGTLTRGTGSGVSAIADGSAVQESGAAGEILRLTASADAIAAGGDYLGFETIARRVGFAVGGISPSFSLPRTGLYVVELRFDWADVTVGGSVAIEINGAIRRVHPDDGPGRGFEWTAMIDGEKGDLLRVKITHDEASSLTASWDMTIAAVEPVGSDPSTVSDDNPEITAAFGYGEFNVSVRIPDSASIGDLLVAHINSRFPTNNAPAGWTRASTASGTSDHRGIVDYKVATSADIGSLATWNGSGGTGADDLSVAVAVVPGIDTDDPFSGTIHNTAADTSSINLSTTIDASSTILLMASGIYNTTEDGTITMSGSTLVEGDASSESGSVTVRATQQDEGTAGSVGPYSVSISPSVIACAAALIPLRKV